MTMPVILYRPLWTTNATIVTVALKVKYTMQFQPALRLPALRQTGGFKSLVQTIYMTWSLASRLASMYDRAWRTPALGHGV